MCGISGIVSSRPSDELAEDLERALASLSHRGPDDKGLWAEPGVALGHRRLSILDLSPGGHQPMHSRSGRYVMVFNGEVYNFADIRRDLAAQGYEFLSSGDSEVVLAALEHWGIETALAHFIGMFAIAVWDRRERRLILIRDRLGVKPLYYGWVQGALWFGSELKALRAYRHWRPENDATAMGEYFKYGYISAPRSIYRHVFKLPPGHWLELKEESPPVVRCYWSILDSLGPPFSTCEDELAEQLEALMIDAFRLRTVSDVPVGVFLSGGIDSSAVAALLQKNHGNIHTFTIGFAEPKYNEAPHARLVADHLGTSHTERVLEVNDAKKIIPEWASLYDEPFSDSSGIPTYLVSRVASEYVKVVLSADGGDELFSGYQSYGTVLELLKRRERIPPSIRAVGGAILRALPIDSIDASTLISLLPQGAQSWTRNNTSLRAKRARDYYFSNDSFGEFYDFATSNSRGRYHLEKILGRSVKSVRSLADSYPGMPIDQMSLWDFHHYLPDCILAKVDRATMAASIEGREPLLDHRLAEFAFRLPPNLRRGKLGAKHLLRKVLYKYVPRGLVDRPKMGFALPQSEWLKRDLFHLVREYLDPQLLKQQGLFDPKGVEEVVRSFRRGDVDANSIIWTLLAFQMWQRRWG